MADREVGSLVRGSCLCGEVAYEVRGAVGDMSHCHCSMCRKGHGAAFATYSPVVRTDFEITRGRHLVREYRSSARVTRSFCGNCGSPLLFIPDNGPHLWLTAGTLDDDSGARPTSQIWIKDKAPWWDLTPEPPAYEKERPER